MSESAHHRHNRPPTPDEVRRDIVRSLQLEVANPALQHFTGIVNYVLDKDHRAPSDPAKPRDLASYKEATEHSADMDLDPVLTGYYESLCPGGEYATIGGAILVANYRVNQTGSFHSWSLAIMAGAKDGRQRTTNCLVALHGGRASGLAFWDESAETVVRFTDAGPTGLTLPDLDDTEATMNALDSMKSQAACGSAELNDAYVFELRNLIVGSISGDY